MSTENSRKAVACILAANSPVEQWRCLITYPDELTNLSEDQVVESLGGDTPTESADDLEQAKGLLRRLKQEELLQVLLSLNPVPEKLIEQVIDYLNAGEWHNVFRYLQANESTLTDPMADVFMQDLLAVDRHDEVRSGRVQIARNLAVAARQQGIEGARAWLIGHLGQYITYAEPVRSHVMVAELSIVPPQVPWWSELMRSYVQQQLNLQDRTSAIERAIGLIERDLLPSIPANLTLARFEALSGLAHLYLHRRLGDHEENVIHALAFSTEALPQAETLGDDRKMGQVHYLLGWAYVAEIAQYDRLSSLMRARDHLTTASSMLRESGEVHEWGQAQLALGHCLVDLAERARNERRRSLLSEAIELLGELEASSPLDIVKIGTRVEAARAYSRYAEFDRGSRSEAFKLIKLALTEVSLEDDPYIWWQIRLRYAETALDALGAGEATDVAVAKQYMLEALHSLDTSLRAEHASTAEALGDLNLYTGDWELALQAYDEACEWGRQMVSSSSSITSREATATSQYVVDLKASYCLCRLGRTGVAVLRAERVKGRTMLDALELERLASLDLPQSQRAALQDAVQAVRSLEFRLRSAAEPASPVLQSRLYAQLYDARSRLAEAVANVRSDNHRLTEDQLVEGDVIKLVPLHGVLFIPIISPVGTALVALDSNTSSLDSASVEYTPFTTKDLVSLIEEYGSYLVRLEDTSDPSQLSDLQLTPLSRLAVRLWEELVTIMAAIARRFAEQGLLVDHLVIISHLGLSTLPLAAAGPDVPQYHPLLENFVIDVLPSASLVKYGRSRSRATGEHQPDFLVVADPTNDLSYARVEVDLIAQQYPLPRENRLEGERATVEAVRQAVSRRPQRLHFACHAGFDITAQWASGLVLSNRIMSAAEVAFATDPQQVGMITLSACKSGVALATRAPEEYGGLVAAFVMAGARSVVSSLWAVDDITTALLMGKFYEHLRSGELVSPALRHSQLWLRSVTAGDLLSYVQSLLKEYRRLSPSERRKRRALLRLKRGLHSIDAAEPPYQHPYYWAAFYALDLESLNEQATPKGE